MDNAVAATWVLMLVVQAIWMLVIPTIVTVAAVKLWGVVPSWIPVAFMAAAAVGVVRSIPLLLMHMHTLSVQQYCRIAMPIAVVAGVTRLVFAVACLGLALTMRNRLTKPRPAAYRR